MLRRISTYAPQVLLGPLLTVAALLAQADAVRGQEKQPQQIDSRFKPVRDLLAAHVEKKQIAGAVALVMERGRVVYSDTVGYCDVAANKPMTKDTLFRIASMTKPVTSVAVMMLYEDGKLNLDDPVSKYIPEFAKLTVVKPGEGDDHPSEPARRPITIRHLLTHTSGITYGFFGQNPQSKLYEAAGVCDGVVETPNTLADNLRRLATCPLTCQPGEAWQYGLSTDVLGRVVEVASGKRLDEFFQERICRPLKMRDTQFFVPEGKRDRLATLYRPGKDKTIEAVGKGVQHAAGLTYSATFQLHGRPKNLSGGAGLVSTAGDYARLLSMLLRGGELDGARLLKPETVAMMTKNEIGDLTILFKIHGDKFGYGFGVHTADSERNGASVGAYSWGGVFNTYFWVDPKREIVGVLMTQLYPFDHLTLWADYQQRVYDALDAGRAALPAARPLPGDRQAVLHFATPAG